MFIKVIVNVVVEIVYMAGNISANENVDLSGSLLVVIDKIVSFQIVSSYR